MAASETAPAASQPPADAVDTAGAGRARSAGPRRWRVSPAGVTVALVILAGAAARIPGLDRALTDRHGFRQTQTAFAIREFARHGPDLLHPPLPIFGPPWSVWLEFPLPQAVASLFVHAGLSSDVAGRLLGLLTLQLTAVLVYFVTRRWVSRRAALVAVVIVEACPLAAQFGFASLIEFSATSCVLATILALARWLDGGRWWWWAAAAVSSALAFLIKVTTASAWLLPVLAVAYLAGRADWRGRWRRVALGLSASPGVGLVAEAWWGRYSNAHNGANPFTRFLEFQNEHQALMGTLHDRLTWSEYAVVLTRIGDLVTGHVALFALAVVVVAVAARHRVFLLAVATVPVVALELWFHVVVQHDYYLCAVLPALAIVMGAAIDVGGTALGRLLHRPGRWGGTAGLVATAACLVATAAVLGLSWRSPLGQVVATNLEGTPQPPSQAAVLQRFTSSQDRIITVGCSWDPRILYYGDRYGLMYTTGAPRLSVSEARTYDFVLTCRGANPASAVPAGVRYVRITHGLFRITAG